jgi:hypothetical protein
MSVARSRLNLRMPEKFPDHRETLPSGDGGRSKSVSQIVDADILKAGARAHALYNGARGFFRKLLERTRSGAAPRQEAASAAVGGQSRDDLSTPVLLGTSVTQDSGWEIRTSCRLTGT